tara:strand:+ start:919 stop:1035 length:117 start_codon:yes stop_codon:yes gene_type:complete
MPVTIPAQINGSAKLILKTLQIINARILIDNDTKQAIL